MSKMILAILLAAVSTVRAFDHEHAGLARVLGNYVVDGRVNYKALQANPADLDAYLDELAGVRAGEFKDWSAPQQLAYLMNLYNAATLKLIVDHYPLKSIKDIGSLFNGPWDQPVVRLFGRVITLDELEHGIIRKDFSRPEIHFALVCAAKGCPPLRDEPYMDERLEEQLAGQRAAFLGATDKNSVDAAAHRVNLSPIFKWYGGDFEKAAGSVLSYLKPFWPEVDETYSISYTRYDWTLNEP